MDILKQIVLRTPLYPFSRSILYNPLKIVEEANNSFVEAIYLSSVPLYNEILKYKAHKNAKEFNKLLLSLYKYLSRASTRCTPFGLFAGSSVGCWGNNTDLTIGNKYVRNTKLDMTTACTITRLLLKIPDIKSYLKFYPNNSINRIGNTLRYIYFCYDDNGRRLHLLNKVDFSDSLEKIFKAAAKGEHLSSLVNLLVSDEITYQEAYNFIEELVESQLLVYELDPNLTGEEYFDIIIRTLGNINTSASSNFNSTLKAIQQELNEIDLSQKNTINPYKEIFNKLTTLANFGEDNLFQVNLYKPNSFTVSDSLKEDFQKTLKFLNKITPPYKNSNIESFKQKFIEKYENEEISLFHALDKEIGIPYPENSISDSNELISDLKLKSINKNQTFSFELNDVQIKMNELLINSIKKDDSVINLKDEDFKDINYTTSNLPHSFFFLAKILNSSCTQIQIKNIGGVSATSIIARYANDNPAIMELIKEVSLHEEKMAGNRILAEIVHLPQTRGNVLTRPAFRKHEIPYLTNYSNNASTIQIEISDLYISVKNNRVILKSKKLNKEIIPRLSNSHIYNVDSLPIYHFLCDLQMQYFDKYTLGFNVDVFSSLYQFLPRIVYNNIILSSAKWSFNKNDVLDLINCTEVEKLTILIKEFKVRFRLPDKIVLLNGDNELFVDFDNEVSISAFVAIIKQLKRFEVEEFLFNEDDLIIKDDLKNGYTNEFIFFVTNSENPFKSTEDSIKEDGSANRSFPLGSEWLYYKLYCGVKTADSILTEVLKPLSEYLNEKGLIRNFFFIRYSDPESHIRFRCRLNSVNNIGEVILIMNEYFQPFHQIGFINKIQVDTYKRELERYGQNTIELTEEFFHIDSVSTLSLLDLIDGNEGEEIKWQFSIRSIDDLLDLFKLNLHEKLFLLNFMKESFNLEFENSKELRLQIDDKFRRVRKKIETILDREKDVDSEFDSLFEILNIKNCRMKMISEQILNFKQQNLLKVNLNDLLFSYVHMMLNRIFNCKQRENEIVIYDLLFRFYKSASAKEEIKRKKQDEILK